MIDELEVKGLEHSLADEEIDGYESWDTHDLIMIFMGLGVDMSKLAISIIEEFCKPGITLVFTWDGGEFAVSTKACKLSTVLAANVKHNPHIVHVTKIGSDTFSLVSSYLNHHNGVVPWEIAKPIRSTVMSRIVEDQWDADFADDMTKRQAFQVINAANYLGCRSLSQLLCAKVATLIKGKSPEEIKHILTTEYDEKDLNHQPEQIQPERLRVEEIATSIEDINLEPLTLEDIEASSGDDANLESEFKGLYLNNDDD